MVIRPREALAMAKNYYAELYFHFVWQTKGRLRLITNDFEQQIWKMITGKSTELGAYPIAIGGIEDHVHLLVSTPPTLLLSDFIGKVKGSTSHYVNHELKYPRRFHWGEGYGVLSLAKMNVKGVTAYIRNQAEHHRRKTTRKIMEHCDQIDPCIVTPVNGGGDHTLGIKPRLKPGASIRLNRTVR